VAFKQYKVLRWKYTGTKRFLNTERVKMHQFEFVLGMFGCNNLHVTANSRGVVQSVTSEGVLLSRIYYHKV